MVDIGVFRGRCPRTFIHRRDRIVLGLHRLSGHDGQLKEHSTSIRFKLLSLSAAQWTCTFPGSEVGRPSNTVFVHRGVLHQVWVLVTIVFGNGSGANLLVAVCTSTCQLSN